MVLSEYVIAIPSYNRPENIKKATLNMLSEYKIPTKKIYIFVANSKQKKLYEKSLDPNMYNKIVIGKVGVKNIRNIMANYFPENQHIFYIDDDIYRVSECVYRKSYLDRYLERKNIPNTRENRDEYRKKGHVLRKLPNLHKFITEGFQLCKTKKMRLFGIYAAYNPYFMKSTNKNGSHISTKLTYVEGGFCGVINSKLAEKRTVADKEDYERSINYYLLNGGVIRYNSIGALTKCYTEPGGMQSTGHRSWERVDKSAKYLVAKYTDLCQLKTSKKKSDKKTGKVWTEIMLRDKRNEPKFGEKIVKKYQNKAPKSFERFKI